MTRGQKPSETQRSWNNAGTQGMNKHALRQKQQIAGQRRMAPYVRIPIVCVCCGFPRDRRSYPVCDSCAAKRKAGLR